MTEPSGRTLCLEPGCQTVIPDRVGGKTFFVHCDEHRFDYTPVAVGGKRGAWKRVKCTACTAIIEKYASTLRGTDRPFCSMTCRDKEGAKPRGLGRRQCAWCPNDFQPKTKRARFCSEKCRLEEQASRPTSRKRRHRTDVELAYMEKKYCPEPGCTNELPPPDPVNGYQRKWCPEHSNRGRRGRPRDTNKMITLTCFNPACGREFEKYRSQVRYNETNRYFCSRECQNTVGSKPREERWFTCENPACERIFQGRRSAVNRFCSADCQNAWQRREQTERTCANSSCGKAFRKPQGDPDIYCSRPCWEQSRQTPIGKRKKTPDGYIIVYSPDHCEAQASGWVFEHRMVMSDTLGRPLASDSTVHHKNRDRSDNRPENLEYWLGNHGKGARKEDVVSDLIAEVAKHDPKRAERLRVMYGEAEDDPPEDPAA